MSRPLKHRYYRLLPNKEPEPSPLPHLQFLARTGVGDGVVLTRFTGVDVSLPGGGPPLLFETLIRVVGAFGWWKPTFGQYSTYWEAMAGHKRAVFSELNQYGYFRGHTDESHVRNLIDEQAVEEHR